LAGFRENRVYNFGHGRLDTFYTWRSKTKGAIRKVLFYLKRGIDQIRTISKKHRALPKLTY
jgi:hypothetical protein